MSSPTKFEQQVLALAGAAQAARMVDQISKTGSYPEEFLQPSLQSLFIFEPESSEQLYGGVNGVKLGLQNLSSMLANRQSAESHEVVRYLFSIIHLEGLFSANPEMMAVVRSRLEHASFNSEFFATQSHNVCASVSSIYQDTLSTFRFRIKVTGSEVHLKDRHTAEIIRALLFAGVRSAFLWRQLGGRRWKLLLRRKQLLQTAQNLSRTLDLV
jgi:high frequency lysogenization protein